MPFVKGICPQCGGQLELDSSLEAAICKYCGTPFIVEKAINNYNVAQMTIQSAVVYGGPSADNLAERGEQFEEKADFEKALEYYNKALDIDVHCAKAVDGISRVETKQKEAAINGILKEAEVFEGKTDMDSAMEYYRKVLSLDAKNARALAGVDRILDYWNRTVLYESDGKTRKESGSFTMTRFKFVFIGNKTGRHEYFLKRMSAIMPYEDLNYVGEVLGRFKSNCIKFKYTDENGMTEEHAFRLHKAEELAFQITRIKNGVKPATACDNPADSLDELTMFIKSNYSEATMLEAIAFYRKRTSRGLKESTDAVKSMLQ